MHSAGVLASCCYPFPPPHNSRSPSCVSQSCSWRAGWRWPRSALHRSGSQPAPVTGRGREVKQRIAWLRRNRGAACSNLSLSSYSRITTATKPYLLAHHTPHDGGAGRGCRHQCSAAAAAAASAAGRGGALLGCSSPSTEALGLFPRGHACPCSPQQVLDWPSASWTGAAPQQSTIEQSQHTDICNCGLQALLCRPCCQPGAHWAPRRAIAHRALTSRCTFLPLHPRRNPCSNGSAARAQPAAAGAAAAAAGQLRSGLQHGPSRSNAPPQRRSCARPSCWHFTACSWGPARPPRSAATPGSATDAAAAATRPTWAAADSGRRRRRQTRPGRRRQWAAGACGLIQSVVWHCWHFGVRCAWAAIQKLKLFRRLYALQPVQAPPAPSRFAHTPAPPTPLAG